MLRTASAMLAAALLLAGCGETKGERTVTGAGIGAGAGAIVGAVTGLTVVEGAIIGAAAGGVAGLLTDKSQVNLGDPVWEQGKSPEPKEAVQAQSAQAGRQSDPQASLPAASLTQQSVRVPAAADTVRSIQSGLAKLGYSPGPADGIPGAKTRAAIRAYQQQYGLPVDGEPTSRLAEHIESQLGAD